MPQKVCPHCGKPLEPRRIEPALEASLEAIVDVIDADTQYGIMLRLLAPRLGEWVSRDEILDAFYGPGTDGPDSGAGIISVVAFDLRKRIARYGLTVEGINRRGQSRYRLLKTNVENATCLSVQPMP